MENLKRTIAIGCGLAVLVAVWFLSGVTGIRVVAGMALVFFLPSYLILRNFELEEDERILFSFFLGFGLFSIVTYYLNKAIPSLRASALITFVLAVLAGVLLRYRKKKTPKTS